MHRLLVGLVDALVDLARGGVQLLAVAAQAFAIDRQLEHELAAFGARQAAESRRLPRDSRDGRRHVGRELGAGDDAVAVQVGLARQRLQHRPGEYRMAAGAVVGHLLVGAAGGDHLAADAPRVVAQEILAAARPAAAREAQARVAGVHQKQHVLGRQRLGHLLQLRHRDGVGGQVVQRRVHRNDVAHVAPARELARAAVAGEEHQHAVVALHALAVGELVVERAQDVGARGLAVVQRGDVLGLEAEARDEQLLHRLGVGHRVVQAGPLGVFVDADHQRVAVAVERVAAGACRGHAVVRRRALGRADHELAVAPGCEAVAVGHQLVEHRGQGLHGAALDVVEQDHAALGLVDLGQHAVGDRLGHRVGPVHGVDGPEHRAQLERLDRAELVFVARA